MTAGAEVADAELAAAELPAAEVAAADVATGDMALQTGCAAAGVRTLAVLTARVCCPTGRLHWYSFWSGLSTLVPSAGAASAVLSYGS